MTLTQLKNSVDIVHIAQELGLQPDKNGKCLCPFHKDKKPSLQFSQKKQIATCFSGNCKAGTMDVIELVKKFYSWELPEAVKWLTPKANGYSITDITKPIVEDYEIIYKKLAAGFNTGKEYDKLKYCIVFPLRSEKGHIVSLYGRSIYDNAKCKHYYTTNRKGLYPNYPNPETKQLIITESIIDAATLKQYFNLSSETTILTAYGTNGLTPEHFKAILYLQQLEEITLWFDGDKAGNSATAKYAKELKELVPNIRISKVEMIENEDINSLLDSHETEILQHLFEKRRIIHQTTAEKEISKTPIQPKKTAKQSYTLNIQPNHTIYKDESLKIDVFGKLDLKDLSRLKMTLVVYKAANLTQTPSRNTIDLYHDDAVEKLVRKIAEKLQIGTSVVRNVLDKITRGLETHRLEKQNELPQQKLRYKLRDINDADKNKTVALLQSKSLIETLTKQLQATGIIGEEKNALFLFTILLSHKMNRTLHAVVQGTSGSGKSHLIGKIADSMYDQNKIKRFTRVTDKSFYNYGEQDLCNCGIILEDYDGLTEEAELAWRELQSNGKLSSSVSQKNEQTGEITTGEKYVFGPIASLVATTHFRIYEDNESRVFVIAIDESEAQTEKVLEYMANKAAKMVTDDQELAARKAIQDIVYMLKPYKVKNPYRLQLPKTTKQRRRLTQMLHDYIEQITLLHQYQRQKVDDTMLVTELKDIEIAIDLMFNSIILKTDELDGILRQFYENLKKYVESKGKDYQFTRREIRQKFRISKTQMQRYITELEELEYIHKSSSGLRNSYNYKISYWDNIEKFRTAIRKHLYDQIEDYKKKSN
ncbi:CHC2 zinc finger domain-containing protein [Aquimarina macrocephali]|uniref:CHC2 zinc finger domain-containing protein n=1 Tax=Aquimarina macrocephali TaxID=666563 RepID=UPI003F67FED8